MLMFAWGRLLIELRAVPLSAALSLIPERQTVLSKQPLQWEITQLYHVHFYCSDTMVDMLLTLWQLAVSGYCPVSQHCTRYIMRVSTLNLSCIISQAGLFLLRMLSLSCLLSFLHLLLHSATTSCRYLLLVTLPPSPPPHTIQHQDLKKIFLKK